MPRHPTGFLLIVIAVTVPRAEPVVVSAYRAPEGILCYAPREVA